MQLNSLNKLDGAHSLLVSLSEEGETSAVLTTIASVLGRIEGLDNLGNAPNYWQTVIVNLNTLADILAERELAGDQVYDETPGEADWNLAELALDDESDLEL